jgi:hypothetical protein
MYWSIREAPAVHTTGRSMCVIKKKGVVRKKVLNVSSGFGCSEFGFL